MSPARPSCGDGVVNASEAMDRATADVVVIGLGALGVSALWRLAERGVDVLGIDQFAVPHAHGATHGKTRLFRTICLEHDALGAWAQLSHRLFDALSAETGKRILDITGGVMIGDPDSGAIRGTRAAARRLGLEVERFDRDQIAARWPAHSDLAPGDVGLFDPAAGAAFPEAYVEAALARARSLGARAIGGVRVTGIRPEGEGLRIDLAFGSLRARQVVLATGVWLQEFAPGLPLDPVRTSMTWFAPAPGFALAQFPVFIREISPTLTLWGHGGIGGGEIKVGLGDVGVPRARLDPAHIDRGIETRDLRALEQAVARYLPGMGPRPSRVDPCVINRTPDNQFIIGRLPALGGRLIAAGGDNGHAFKHAPAIGEVVAAITTDTSPPLETDFIDPGRFARVLA